MKVALANKVRAIFVEAILEYLRNDLGEDVGMISSNTINLPAVVDEEECFVEISVKVTKKSSDECYQERVDYINKEKLKAEKKALREKEAAEKKAKAEAKKKEKGV